MTFEFTNEYHEKTSITVNKVWEDEDNAENLRPESITVRLLANGTEVAQATLTAAGGWTYTFENVEARQDGAAILMIAMAVTATTGVVLRRRRKGNRTE